MLAALVFRQGPLAVARFEEPGSYNGRTSA